VKDDYLRFDFSHFQKLTDEEVRTVETMVNQKIRSNIALQEDRSISIKEAQAAGAMMLFGEKYGDTVRMITFDPDYSRELCGGCHVENTGQIGYFKITSEGGIAAGVRRIEAITADAAEAYINTNLDELHSIKQLFKNPKDTAKNVADLQDENKSLKKKIEQLMAAQAAGMKGSLISGAEEINGIKYVAKTITGIDSNSAKTLATNIVTELGDAVVALGLETDGGKVQLMLAIAKGLKAYLKPSP